MINNRQNGRRRRGGGGPRPNGGGSGPDRGNRIDNRARGNANQLYEKYKTLARDSQMQGDRVTAEYYFQFADHYFRVLSENRPRFEEQRRDRYDGNDFDDEGEGDAAGADERGEERPFDHRNDREERSERVERHQRADQRPAYNGRDAAEPREAELPLPIDTMEAPVAADDEPRGARRGRPRRPRVNGDDTAVVQERIEIDRLPPAFATPEPAAEIAAAEAPRKRRTRKPKDETAGAEI